MSTAAISLSATLRGGNVLTKVMSSRVRGVALAAASPMTKAQAQRNSASATFDIMPYKLHKLDKAPAQTATITSEEAVQLYTSLQTLRRLETGTATLYKEKVIRGFCHLYSGQEAIAVGMKAVMRPQDTIVTSYRCHAWTYLMDGTAVGVLAELTGRKSGCVRGKGGSMHMYGKNFYGGNGIVGAQGTNFLCRCEESDKFLKLGINIQICGPAERAHEVIIVDFSCPLGAGVAFAHKYKGDGGICFTLYGDGAANQGQLFEAMNIAKLWMLPCVFLCENNRYGLGTSMQRSSASIDYYQRGDYIPGVWVDGMDVLACKEATRYAIEWCTSGKGPLVLEMETYRYYGHSMSDPGTSYRTRDEVAQVRKTRDPITSFKEKILSKKLITADKIKEIDKAARKEIDQALKISRTDAEIGLEELAADIYYECLENPIRGVRPDTPLTHLALTKRN